MKRLQFCLYALIMLAALHGNAVDIYVSPLGLDSNDGTKDAPFATLAKALRKARELRRLNDLSIAGGIHIILRGGLYALSQPVVIRPEDGGAADSPTFIEAMTGERPILSGGVQLRGWTKPASAIPYLPANASGKIWETTVPTIDGNSPGFRQLWVDGARAVRAKSCNGDSMDRILDWNKKDASCWIHTPAIASLANTKGIELFIHQWWAIAVLRVRSMEVHGDSTRLLFHEPESRIQNEHPWPAPWLSRETGNSAFYLVNAIQFLDEPGEWFFDAGSRKVYYWPRPGEDMNRASVFVPVLETLIDVQGSVDHPVQYLNFSGISFQYSGWLRPSTAGHVPHQAGLYMTEAYTLKPPGVRGRPGLDNQAWIGRPSAAVMLNYAVHTTFQNCRFEHLAATGLDYHRGAVSNSIVGNLFRDIGGNGILAGTFADEATEIHQPFKPHDEREVCDSLAINNNLVSDVSNEDWGCVGIGIGYSRNTLVEHNEIENLSYTGLSMGWGWTPQVNVMKNNRVAANYIHHYGRHNYDCAGIYTLSAQPGSSITGNRVDSIFKAPYAHLPSHWFYLYCDEGTSGVTVENNWTPSGKYLQNANGPGNNWINNGPQVSDEIRQHAGLLPAYQFLSSGRTASRVKQAINEEHPEVIELITSPAISLDIHKLRNVLAQNNVDSASVYRWKDHYVIFSKIADLGVLQGKLQSAFPRITVRVYYDLFYVFERKKNCVGAGEAREWDHVLLTANLVRDEKKRSKYLEYHARQYIDWPEVARGFCNAGFQRLLLFRNDRQLMLIISIPKGETLDKLNPLTIANNPRMIKWNEIMSGYQEGIEGTGKNEVWVELRRVE